MPSKLALNRRLNRRVRTRVGIALLVGLATFLCLLGFWFLPRARPGRIALAVLMMTCLLECLQRWHPAWLEWLRSFWLGQLLLGTTFAGSDFPYDFLGAGLGWLWIQRFHPAKTDRGGRRCQHVQIQVKLLMLLAHRRPMLVAGTG